ncbi:3-deoxy-D-manno-octulosonic acid transferase [Acidovorax lacteus]|uniref:3-deoxy-D-manno-octulosonic acid transferase n=1 Tax=Acidovorax lacteus TaxID=1924988 RepID=A0ABP8L1Z1_9BURK
MPDLVRAAYSALMWLAQPLLLRKLRRRGRDEPGYLAAIPERFGRYPRPIDSLVPYSTMDPLGQFVWVHAVSLGETRAAAVLLARLRARLPGMRLLLTHSTATGRAEGEKLLTPGDVQVWLPWDTPGAVARFLRQFRPAVGVLMETEVWPNLVEACRARGVPLVLANARLNARSLQRALRLALLARPAYRGLAAVYAQTAADADRLRALGAPVAGVFGNLKFDATPDAELLAQGRAWRAAAGRPVVLLASSREGEEALWLQALQNLQGRAGGAAALAGVQWLVVPRHPQRFDEVAALLRSSGLTVSRRSAWAAAPEPAQVWLGDSLGEMPRYYGMADVVLLGGSFGEFGGQNLIEAAACGCPVVLGPHTFNFSEAAEQACEAQAAQRVADMAVGLREALAWLVDTDALAQRRTRALAFATAHRGAAEATADAIAALLWQGRAGR